MKSIHTILISILSLLIFQTTSAAAQTEKLGIVPHEVQINGQTPSGSSDLIEKRQPATAGPKVVQPESGAPGVIFSSVTVSCKSGNKFKLSTGNKSGKCAIFTNPDNTVSGGSCRDDTGGNSANANCNLNNGAGGCSGSSGSGDCTQIP